MGKVLGSWSGMRKYLEKDMLAESLKGRVRYNCTRYVGMDNCHIFEVFIDNNLVKQFSWETLQTYFINQGYKSNDSNLSGVQQYWEKFWQLQKKYPMEIRTEYTDDEFAYALEQYRNQSINESLCSYGPIVRMFAVLDRRVGKRTLGKIKSDIDLLPEWLKQFYKLRIDSENISL